MPSVDFLPFGLLAIVAPIVLVLALGYPPHFLLLLDLVLVVVSGDWSLGLRVDVTDLVFLGLVIALLARRGKRGTIASLRPPYMRLWVLLGVLSSIAYLLAPTSQEYLTDPARIAYQVYRYCWKPILYYPLTIALLAEPRKLRTALVAVIVSADLAALQAIQQGYVGDRANGPFSAPNALGSAMIIPSLLCLAGILTSTPPRQRAFYLVSSALLARTLLFSGSRGAFVATLAASALVVCFLLGKTQVRQRIFRLGAIVGLLGVVLLASSPGLLERPNVKRMLSASEGVEADTFQWRLQERWPHFWRIVQQNPWFGVGTEVDLSLGRDANTPHNGYLAIALISGLPALGVILTFALLGVRSGLRVYRRARYRRQSVFGITIAAALIGVLIHNIDDATLQQAFISKVFWLLTGLAVAVARRPALVLTPTEALQTATSRGSGEAVGQFSAAAARV